MLVDDARDGHEHGAQRVLRQVFGAGRERAQEREHQRQRERAARLVDGASCAALGARAGHRTWSRARSRNGSRHDRARARARARVCRCCSRSRRTRQHCARRVFCGLRRARARGTLLRSHRHRRAELKPPQQRLEAAHVSERIQEVHQPRAFIRTEYLIETLVICLN